MHDGQKREITKIPPQAFFSFRVGREYSLLLLKKKEGDTFLNAHFPPVDCCSLSKAHHMCVVVYIRFTFIKMHDAVSFLCVF